MLKIVLKLLPLFALLFLSSHCSKDDNPVDDSDTDHGHAEAVGFVLSSSGIDLIRYEKGVIAGELEVEEGELTPLLTINFIAEDGDLFQPDGEHFKLNWEVDNTDIADVVQHEEDGKWRFHIQGKQAGETTIIFEILHGDHADFVSLPIPVHVHEHDDQGHGEAVGLALIKEATGDTLLKAMNMTVTGAVSLKNGEDTGHLAVRFVDANGIWFTPEDDHTLGITVGNTEIAEVEQHEGEPWTIEVKGKKVGSTTFTLSLLHDGHSHYTSPDLPVEVTL